MGNISFIITVAKNELEYIKLLLKSLKTNLDGDNHEIVIFLDSDNQNTFEHLLSEKENFNDLKIIKNELPFPIGYQRNKTLLVETAKYDIVSYLQSDMVISPHYDTEILKHVKRGRILSSTRIEPPLHGESSYTITKNFGLTPSEFTLEEWNDYSVTVKEDKELNYFFAPITFFKQDWLFLGGYDTLFRRSREDSDFVHRCLQNGIELKQTFSTNVYHFTCVSSRGKDWFNQTNYEAQERGKLQKKADSIELRRFVRKWGQFNHGESNLYKFDIDLVVKNYNQQYLNIIEGIEPYFSRVWLDESVDLSYFHNKTYTEHELANILLNLSDDEWNSYKHLYNTVDYSEIYLHGEPKDYSIKIELDFHKLNMNVFLGNLKHLYEILNQNEVGTYNLDDVVIYIKEKKLMDNSKLDNPPFDYNLISIH